MNLGRWCWRFTFRKSEASLPTSFKVSAENNLSIGVILPTGRSVKPALRQWACHRRALVDKDTIHYQAVIGTHHLLDLPHAASLKLAQTTHVMNLLPVRPTALMTQISHQYLPETRHQVVWTCLHGSRYPELILSLCLSTRNRLMKCNLKDVRQMPIAILNHLYPILKDQHPRLHPALRHLYNDLNALDNNRQVEVMFVFYVWMKRNDRPVNVH